MKRNRNRYTGSGIPEMFIIDIREKDGTLRIDTQRGVEGVMKLIANTAEVDGLRIENIQKYKAGTYHLVEMEVKFINGKLMLVEVEAVEEASHE